ncbi:gliding motility-associated C-terminal domain-containing protein [Flagellimonas sp. HMM57]|uniref:T9SS type B sorting domain-containing protein n=1 Tax=unclassified Flagellimonas TaxID=2644544 RepID=UPI0013D5C2A1|nr:MULTISPECIES: gliding motility-associated C-terminal domain-containing protein [unclassified Flagellimonas]UII77632.1 gliding motility-associated C-terminal domain-containing protein [Flagellimonas sp. HMM57]
MKTIGSHFSILLIACAMTLLGANSLHSQVLNKPTTVWTAACASVSFNEYDVSFGWTPPLVDSNNEFILELSDANGNFGSPRELSRLSDKNADFNFDFTFAVPTDVNGENFKLRVRSTSPAKTSPATDAYPMYFVDYNSPLLISENGSGSIPPGGTIEICGSGSVTLSPHNIPNPNNYSYNWYRSGTLLSEKSKDLTVSTTGMYYVELDYGTVCSGSANTLSNTIEISTGTSQGIAINGSNNVGLCPGDPYTLTANISGSGLTYTWYKDGAIVSGPTVNAHTYAVNTSASGYEGNYEVEISGAGACQERSAPVAINNLGNFDVTRQNDANIVLLPSQTKTLSVTTTATTPTYQWFKDGSPIIGADEISIDVNEVGVYYVRVTETGGSCSAAPIDSESTTIVSPSSFEFVVDFAGTYTSCENTEATLNLSTINAVSSSGAKTDVTSDLLSSFTYQWTKDASNVSGETSRTIIVSNFNENGAYRLEGTLNTFNASSNDLDVKLASNEVLTITSNETVLCEGGDPIVLETSKNLSGETFEWIKDGQVIDTTTENLIAVETGTYQLIVKTNDCPIVSNEITIVNFDDSLLVLDRPQDLIIIEGETVTITASGATSYEWLNADNSLLGSLNSFSFNQEGEFLLVASFGSCTVSRVITVTFRDTFAIPNVITTNGDGINDLWVLPNTYSRDQETLVTIYDERGKEVFSQTNYENNWPQSTTAFTKQSMIFYYRITKGGESLKQGTITVIK